MTTLPWTLTDQELQELIDLVKVTYGFDFSNYSKASLKRRLSRIVTLKKVGFKELKETLTHNPDFFRWFLNEVTVNVTEMFRDPSFYKALNSLVVPYLSKFENVKVWSAGCSSGEEVYSLAILLYQAKLVVEPFICGTDINTAMIEVAQKGIYSMRKIKSYAENYTSCELPGELTDHFDVLNEEACIKTRFKQNTLFSVYNLVTDDAFNEFQVISCRNVFIYFEAELQEKILGLFYKSLSSNGFLCLGSKETIRFPEYKNKFRVINQKENIYQKVGE